MPPLDEETALFMPITDPRISLTEATRDSSPAGPNHRRRSRRRNGCGQSGPCGNLHRSGAGEHERNNHHLQAKGPMAEGANQRRHPRAARREATDSRRDQHLDAADSQSHRHALDRHSHADRHQGLRTRSERDRTKVGRDQRSREPDSRRNRPLCRANHWFAISGDDRGPRRRRPLRIECRRCRGCD